MIIKYLNVYSTSALFYIYVLNSIEEKKKVIEFRINLLKDALYFNKVFLFSNKPSDLN